MLGRVEAPIADQFANHSVVLLLDKGVVVLASNSTSSEGQLVLFAIPDELVVDEFGAIVGIDSEQAVKAGTKCPKNAGMKCSLFAG